jgi:hypothetical protein
MDQLDEALHRYFYQEGMIEEADFAEASEEFFIYYRPRILVIAEPSALEEISCIWSFKNRLLHFAEALQSRICGASMRKK